MPAHVYSTRLWAWQIFVVKWRTKWTPQCLLGSCSSHWGPVPLSPQLPESVQTWALWPRKGALLCFTALSGRFLRDPRGCILSSLPYAVHIAVWAPRICNSTTALRVLCVWGKPRFPSPELGQWFIKSKSTVLHSFPLNCRCALGTLSAFWDTVESRVTIHSTPTPEQHVPSAVWLNMFYFKIWG